MNKSIDISPIGLLLDSVTGSVKNKLSKFDSCAENRNLNYCFQCRIYPCKKFQATAQKLKQEGENLKFNLKMIEIMGEEHFLSFKQD